MLKARCRWEVAPSVEGGGSSRAKQGALKVKGGGGGG